MKLRLAVFIVLLVASASAAPLKIELPPETSTFKTAPGADLAMSQCLMCHSTEYISTQPALSPVAWKVIVEKMQKKYGAPLPAEQVDPVVDYLTKNYGAHATPAPAPTISPAK